MRSALASSLTVFLMGYGFEMRRIHAQFVMAEMVYFKMGWNRTVDGLKGDPVCILEGVSPVVVARVLVFSGTFAAQPDPATVGADINEREETLGDLAD
jgi:hypothetical protein